MLFPGIRLFPDSGVQSRMPVAKSTPNLKSKMVRMYLLKEISSYSRATVQAMSEWLITPAMGESTISMETIRHTETGIIPLYTIPTVLFPRKPSRAY